MIATLEVLIIGAGMSGVSCAHRFSTVNGVKVTILEAKQQIGGRIGTCQVNGIQCDTGAMWIHGWKDNPLTDLAKRYGISIQERTEKLKKENVRVTIDATGKRVPHSFDIDVRKKFTSWLEDIVSNKISELTEDITIREAMNRFGKRELIDEIKLAWKDVVEQEDDEFVERVLEQKIVEFEDWNGASVEWMSTMHYVDEFKEYEGGDRFVVGSYLPMVQGLAREFIESGKGDILLGHVVQQIAREGEKVKVSGVTDLNGENDNFSLLADCVVIALPLGVLQASFVSFDPPLPEPKMSSIRRLGMGLLNKVIMVFSETFWNPNTEFYWYCADVSKHGEFPLFVNLQYYTGKEDHVLIGFCVGKFALEMEKMKDEEIVNRNLQILGKHFGRKPMDTFVASKITRWAEDRYARGSYSFVAMGATGEDLDVISEPVDDKLFFAGEASIRQYYSMLHGAHLAGIREAERIIALHKLG